MQNLRFDEYDDHWVSVQTAVELVKQLALDRSTRPVISIAGGSQSGKTVFASKLANSLAVMSPMSLEMDDFFFTPDELLELRRPVNFDEPSAVNLSGFADCIHNFLVHSTVAIPQVEYVSGEDGTARTVRKEARIVDTSPCRALIAEGLFCHYRTVAQWSSVVVLIHDFDRVRARENRIVRDTSIRGYSADASGRRWDSEVEPALARWIWPGLLGVELRVDIRVRR